MLRLAALILCLGLSLGLAAAWSAPAAAHASLVESRPTDGAVLAEAPQRFELRFNEPVMLLVLRLVSADGSTTELARYRLDGATLVVDAPELGRGTHALSWRVASEDGHPIGGTILFSIGTPGAGPSLGPTGADGHGLRLAIWSARLAIYLGLVLGVGGVCFGTIAELPRPARRVAGASLLLGLAAVPLSVGLQGLDALALPFAALVDADTWRAGLRTAYGATAVIATVAMAAALAGLAIDRGIAIPALAAIALVAGGMALAASGHAGAAQPQLLTRPAVFLHVAAVTLWGGALLPLALVLHQSRSDAAAALARFSRLIPYAVAALVVSGLTLAMVQLERPSALWSTAYGRLLLAKLALLVPLFALAAANRWRLTGRAVAGEAIARRHLVRAVAVEIVLVLAILGVVGGWRFTPPPRALAEAAAPAAPRQLMLHLRSGAATAHLTIAPARLGPVSAAIHLMSGAGAPLAAQEVTLVLASPENGIEPIRRAAAGGRDGHWRVDELVIPAAGSWTLRLDILVSDFERIRLEDSFAIPR